MIRLFGKIRWSKLLKTVLAGVGLTFIVGQLLYILLLHAGPSVEAVRQKVATAMGVPFLELSYVGGYLRRESRVLFHREGDTPFVGEHEEVSPEAQSYEIVTGFLKSMSINVDKGVVIKVIKFPMEFDTVFCIVCGKEQWIIFYGNTVM